MIKDAKVDTGVSTINNNIQELLSTKNYPPSYIARLINRSIEDKRYRLYDGVNEIRKGHPMESNEYFIDFDALKFNITSSGKKLYYPNITMPSYYGRYVLEELDELVDRINPATLNDDGFYKLLAMMVVGIGSAHTFPDGNGRTAIGLADVYIRKYRGKKLDRQKLQAQNNSLTLPMLIGSIMMLPDTYQPNYNFTKMKIHEEKKVIIPMIGVNSKQEVKKFADEYAASICNQISEFDPYQKQDLNQPYTLTNSSIMPIAELLKEVTV